ncbi:hypothetical protein N7495_005788 [Penicillium taxi]|uniref:uncharacterized protein n=1 Tax=Penicillium taxi TaxID=168475 RepID=UPI002545046C|nr:uncharacterized protein N7495_005788 [Penicillium taxi]KAJ5894097.1 hypothetical protein N7495_005788 [Penicillium taxi]
MAMNLIFIITAAGMATRYDNNAWGDSAVIYQGNCGTVKRWDLGLHLIINVLSTLLLAASNYCMQTLVAPTREEVDKAHARGKWLDIGGASIKNLRAIGRDRLWLWITLMLTATPFHLMYNSIVFGSLSEDIVETFVAPKDLNSSNVYSLTSPALDKCFAIWKDIIPIIASGIYERHDWAACSSVGSWNSTYSVLIILAENLTVSDGGNSSILNTPGPYLGNHIVEAAPFFNESAGVGASTQCQDIYFSAVSDYTANECLIIKDPGHCQLLYSPPICLAIALAIFVKVSAMFLAARIGRNRSPPLLTVGDAISSFLSKPDYTTKDICWLSSKDARNGTWSGPREENTTPIYNSLSKPQLWLQATTCWRWIATLFLWLSTLFAGIALFFISVRAAYTWSGNWISANQLKNLFSSNVNLDDYQEVFGIPIQGMLQSVVLANVPQLVVTMCYYCYNAVLTSMLAATEYSTYGIERKALRVTWPIKESQQRSTYYLSIPYRYGVPVLFLYMTLHWTISQSIFYLAIDFYEVGKESKDGRLGFSPIFILLSILVGAVMILTLCILAFKRLKSNVPLAGSCSAAISAACHAPTQEDSDTAIRSKVKWGQTTGLPFGFIDSEGGEKGHCSFTSLDTVKPTLTKLYA